jgi:MATE family multidrug resistance protein
MEDDSLTLPTLPWQERPLHELLRLAWPIMVSLLSFSVMTAVDSLFVGRLGAAALAGVGLGGAASFTTLCFGFGLLRAGKITVAQAAGAGRHHATQAYLGASLTVALGLGIATAVVGQGVAWLLPWLTASADSARAAGTYTSIRTLSAPITLLTIAMRETRHGLGDARSPMRATLLANLINVGLVAVFSIGFGWGVAGVAWATTLAQLTELLMLAHMQRAHGFGLSAWSRDDLRTVLSMGVPLGIERFFDVSSFTVMVALFARMGDVDLAAHQVAAQALLFAFMPSMAIGDATCVLIGQAVGASSLHSVPRVQRSALAAGFAYVAICCAGLLVFGPRIAQMFTHDAAVIARAAELFQVGAVFVWTLPFYQVGQNSLRAIGDVRVAAWITVGAAWGCTPLFAAVLGLALGMGAWGGWIGLGSELALAAALFWWRLRTSGGAWLRHARRLHALRLEIAL